MASGANLLMNMFGRPRGNIGRLGGVIMARRASAVPRPDRGIRFAHDSPLEGGGFEPSIPREEKAHLRCPQKELCSAWRARHYRRSHRAVWAPTPFHL